MFQGIDLFSDTATRPSHAMKQAMMDALVGDEQQGEDPTTLRLEERMAQLLGKERALFLPSATMCNQIAVKLLCEPGDEAIGAESCHIFMSEGAGAAFHAGVQARPIRTEDATFDGAAVLDHVRTGPWHLNPRSALVIVENTTNAGGGVPWPKDKLLSVRAVAKERGLQLHLDGARLFNASVATGTAIRELASGFDTITVCFSKGLGCATGAILAFDQKHWVRARRFKQIFGGALRQSGMLSAACLFALDHYVADLARDHENAQALAEGLSKNRAVLVLNMRPQSNMVFFSVDAERLMPDKFLSECARLNVRFSRVGTNRFRAVTHRDVSRAQIDEVVGVVAKVFEN